MTRPEPAASRTAERLMEAGFSPVLLPLSRTVPLDFDSSEQDFDAIAVTSANAFRHVKPEQLSRYEVLPLFAVGEGTARAARAAGFADVTEGGGDALRLAATMAKALPQGARVLYLAGRVRQPVFEEAVAAAGLTMTVREVYDVERIIYAPERLAALSRQGPFVAVLLYSGEAAAALVDTMRDAAPFFGPETRFLCISARVADGLPPRWRGQVMVADHPDEEGLFRLLDAV